MAVLLIDERFFVEYPNAVVYKITGICDDIPINCDLYRLLMDKLPLRTTFPFAALQVEANKGDSPLFMPVTWGKNPDNNYFALCYFKWEPYNQRQELTNQINQTRIDLGLDRIDFKFD